MLLLLVGFRDCCKASPSVCEVGFGRSGPCATKNYPEKYNKRRNAHLHDRGQEPGPIPSFATCQLHDGGDLEHGLLHGLELYLQHSRHDGRVFCPSLKGSCFEVLFQLVVKIGAQGTKTRGEFWPPTAVRLASNLRHRDVFLGVWGIP